MIDYDAVVIGAGPGGYEAAIKLSRAGLKTALIEKSKEKIGGVCLNEGCIPAKTYLQSSELFLKTAWYKELGIDLEIKGFDLKRLQSKAQELKKELRSGVLWLLEQANVDIIYGEAIFQDKDLIALDSQEIRFKKCIIATGSVPREIALFKYDGKYILSSKDIFALEKLPSSIAIIGSGAIGCEFASFFSALGIDTTIICRSEYLLPKEDIEISKALMRVLKKKGVKLNTNSKIKDIQIENEKVLLDISNERLKVDIVLAAIGRVPNTKNLALEKSGVEVDEKGFITVDKTFQTTRKNIFAIGDCIDTLAYAHVAHSEAAIAVQNIIEDAGATNSSVVPSVIFTIPQIASCGLNESEAKEKGYDTVVKKNYFKADAKAKILGDDSGFVKVIICAKSDEVLGASIIGIDASEIIHILTTAIESKMKFSKLKKLVFAHPTISEIIALL